MASSQQGNVCKHCGEKFAPTDSRCPNCLMEVSKVEKALADTPLKKGSKSKKMIISLVAVTVLVALAGVIIVNAINSSRMDSLAGHWFGDGYVYALNRNGNFMLQGEGDRRDSRGQWRVSGNTLILEFTTQRPVIGGIMPARRYTYNLTSDSTLTLTYGNRSVRLRRLE